MIHNEENNQSIGTHGERQTGSSIQGPEQLLQVLESAVQQLSG